MVPDQELDALLKRLHLANTRRAWRELARRAEQEDWTYHDFLTLLVTEEIAHRQQTRLERVVRRARFPLLKTIDDFNFLYQSTVRLSLLGSRLSADFTTEGHCVIFNGKPGLGKTHLAIAIAYRAIQHGFDALFVTAAELIDDLSAAFRAGRFAAALVDVHASGDLGRYLTCGTDAANVLFHVVNDRHRKKRAMIFTTNKPLHQWGRVLHDEDLAHAIVDRVLERGRFLTLDGPSMRTKHLGIDDPTSEGSQTVVNQPATISGIQAPEFPEPTRIVAGTARCPLGPCGLVAAQRSAAQARAASPTTFLTRLRRAVQTSFRMLALTLTEPRLSAELFLTTQHDPLTITGISTAFPFNLQPGPTSTRVCYKSVSDRHEVSLHHIARTLRRWARANVQPAW